MNETAALFARARTACATAGRDPDTLAPSVAHATVVGKDDAEVGRRLEAYGGDPDADLDHLDLIASEVLPQVT